MTVHRDDDMIHVHFQQSRHGGNDAQIGLMRYQPVEVRFLQTVRVQRLLDDAAQRAYRHLEDLVAAHDDLRLAVVLLDGFPTDGHACIGREQSDVVTVRVHVRRQDAGFL